MTDEIESDSKKKFFHICKKKFCDVDDSNDDEFDARRFLGDVVDPDVDDYDKYDHEEFEVMRFHGVSMEESDHCLYIGKYRVAVCYKKVIRSSIGFPQWVKL